MSWSHRCGALDFKGFDYIVLAMSQTNEEKLFSAFNKGQELVNKGKMKQTELSMPWAMNESKVPRGSVGASVGRLVKSKCLKRFEGNGSPYYKVTGKPYKSPGKGNQSAIRGLVAKVDMRKIGAFKKGLNERQLAVLNGRILTSPPVTLETLSSELGVSTVTITKHQRNLLKSLQDAGIIRAEDAS